MVIFEGLDSATDLVFDLSGDIIEINLSGDNIEITPELLDAEIDGSKLTINSFAGFFPFKVKTVNPNTLEEFEYNDTFDFPEGEKIFFYEKRGGSITIVVTVFVPVVEDEEGGEGEEDGEEGGVDDGEGGCGGDYYEDEIYGKGCYKNFELIVRPDYSSNIGRFSDAVERSDF